MKIPTVTPTTAPIVVFVLALLSLFQTSLIDLVDDQPYGEPCGPGFGPEAASSETGERRMGRWDVTGIYIQNDGV